MFCSSRPGQAFGAETWSPRSVSGDAEQSNLAGPGGATVVPDTLQCENQNGSGTFMRYVCATSLASFALTLHSRDVPACRRPSPPRTVIPVFPQCKYAFGPSDAASATTPLTMTYRTMRFDIQGFEHEVERDTPQARNDRTRETGRLWTGEARTR